ncbi:MAG: hypothetical protein H6861_02685 [Rhodospirillales bacterium]|nr:hypothetical protein [Rhodospirillales bacterium]
MDHNSPAQDDPQQLQNAQAFWHSFMHGAKIGIIMIALVVIVLALAFVPTGS